MNKKVFRNILLLGLVVVLSLTVIDFNTSKPSFEEAIGYFIQENLEGGVSYSPLETHQVNEQFLNGLTDVQESFITVRDSINNQLGLISTFNSTTNTELIEAKLLFENLSISSLNQYLIIDARLKSQIKTKQLKDLIREEELKMHEGLDNLNIALSAYNVSVFNLNFETSESHIYFHKFRLNSGSNDPTNHEGIFELDKKTKAVLSFKEI